MQSTFPLIPESASTLSSEVDAIYFYISGVTVVLIVGLLLVLRRRGASDAPAREAGQ